MKVIDAVLYDECEKQYISYAVLEGAVCADKPPRGRFRCACCFRSTDGKAFRSIYIKSDVAGKGYYLCAECFKEEQAVLKAAVMEYKKKH